MYPEKTITINSNFTCRSFKHALPTVTHSVVAGSQMLVRRLHNLFQKKFFELKRKDVKKIIETEFSIYQGSPYDAQHFMDLYDLGFLPLRIKAIEEGELLPVNIPVLTITNTHNDFAWLVNYLETYISNNLWMTVNSATIAYQFKKLLTEYAVETDQHNLDFIDFQAHDFSMRGMGGNATKLSGLGHDFSFKGSDNIPTIRFCRKYYDAKGFIIGGVPATEHSVMCAGEQDNEIETIRRLLKIFPKGLLSIVCDTWDFWQVVTEYLPILKEEILARDGRLVIRPDSGDPVDIICGWGSNFPNTTGQEDVSKFHSDTQNPEFKGLIECLWDIFGGTINDQGYKVLDSHIGAIYGDSITFDRAQQICKKLKDKDFASTSVVLGIGSYTYQYNTRDTLGMACKATFVQIQHPDGTIEDRNIFKNPKTDSGSKKSAKGLLKVDRIQGAHGMSDYFLKQEVSKKEEQTGYLNIIYENGKFYNKTTLENIRAKIDHSIKNVISVKQNEIRNRKKMAVEA
jgi:nicotinamide phosphoribosyltransferase